MKLRTALLAALSALAFIALGCNGNRIPPFPPTEKHPVTAEYFGTKITDDYRWLDDLKDPAVRKWNDAQNAYTRSILDKFPSWEPLYKRIQQLLADTSASYYSLTKRGNVFAMKNQPPKNQPFLVILPSLADLSSEKIVVDPNQLNLDGTTSIDWFVPSRDGKLVAVSLSERGSEDGTGAIFDVETGKRLGDVIPRIQYPTAGGTVEWNADNTGFYYTRYPQGNERPREDANFYQQVYFHKLGTPASKDTYVIGKEFPRIAEITLSSTDDGKYILATVANGDGGDVAHYVMGPGGKWTQLTTYDDQIKATAFGPDGTLYLLSRKGAPKGQILAVRFTGGRPGKPTPVVKEGEWSLISLLPTKSRIYVGEILGGPERVAVFDLKGNFREILPSDSVASVEGLVRLDGDDILYGVETFTTPFAFHTYDAVAGRSTKTSLAQAAKVDMSDIEVTREFAPSKDGMRVPMNILKKKGTVLNGLNPTILYGYGGYGMNETPYYAKNMRFWFDHGGIYVTTNLRGGGEYGEEWHKAGNLTKKQNVFDDFAACARWLIDKKYTNASKLVAMGGSNGGLLMGAALTQHPELFRAVVSYVGIYDMLRVELSPNGEFNTTEFGSVKNPDQFKALYAYSPLHHVVDGTKYPAVLFVTGDNDGRVDPANSRKMTARLQAATASGYPILLRTSSNAGHGIGTSLNDRISERADVYAFIFQQLGMEYK
jgi:prolyl oligopeptidase